MVAQLIWPWLYSPMVTSSSSLRIIYSRQSLMLIMIHAWPWVYSPILISSSPFRTTYLHLSWHTSLGGCYVSLEGFYVFPWHLSMCTYLRVVTPRTQSMNSTRDNSRAPIRRALQVYQALLTISKKIISLI